jgi:hypothetical protein
MLITSSRENFTALQVDFICIRMYVHACALMLLLGVFSVDAALISFAISTKTLYLHVDLFLSTRFSVCITTCHYGRMEIPECSGLP